MGMYGLTKRTDDSLRSLHGRQKAVVSQRGSSVGEVGVRRLAIERVDVRRETQTGSSIRTVLEMTKRRYTHPMNRAHREYFPKTRKVASTVFAPAASASSSEMTTAGF